MMPPIHKVFSLSLEVYIVHSIILSPQVILTWRTYGTWYLGSQFSNLVA